MATPRPPIPAAIKRAVRQRCAFGWVLCGLPLYAYDHVVPWSTVKQHTAENILLLCERHHREKTSGLLPDEAIEGAALDPYNGRAGVSAPYDLHYGGTQCLADVGSNVYEWSKL